MNAESIFKLLDKTREHLTEFLIKLSPEQLAFIPEGFNNNIFWNIAHCVATQQMLCYKLSHQPFVIPEEFIQKYKKGTFPEPKKISIEEITTLIKYLEKTQIQLQEDYKNQRFEKFDIYPASYGFVLHNIDDAILFLNAHNAMHYGTIKAIRYFV